MARVGVLFHPGRENARSKAEDLRSWLHERDHEYLNLSDCDQIDQLDLVVSLGGDGTMLRAIDKVSSKGLPVLGVNFGSLGYLTEIDPDSLFIALRRFFDNDYLIEERMTLNVKIESRQLTGQGHGGLHSSFVALNEMVVEKLSSGHVIRVEVSIGNEQFLTYEADGIIASTPTGSTAYNFSSRGPVLSPSLRAIIITPISPHMLFDRSLVLESHETVSFKIVEGPSAAVMVDGVQKARIDPGDRVICTCYETPARLVTFGKKDFHQILKMKFGLSSKQMGI